LADGADDDDSQGDHEGAGSAVPQRVEGGKVGDSGRGVCGDGVPPGLRPPALRLTLTPREIKAGAPRPPKFDVDVVAALENCWAVANAPAGQRLAPLLAELVPVLRRCRKAGHRRGRCGSVGIDECCDDRPPAGAGSLQARHQGPLPYQAWVAVKSRIPMRTWADH